MEKSLLTCCEQLYLIVTDIRGKAIQIDADFFEVLKNAFEQFEKNAALQGLSQSEIQLGKYALVALVDELILHYYPNVNHNWPARSLQLYYYQSNIAGNQFFESLDELLLNQASHRILLEVYYFCLNLGFKGQYRNHPDRVNEYKQALGVAIAPDPVVHASTTLTEYQLPCWLLAVLMVAFTLLIYFIFVACVSDKIFVVTTDLNAYAEQLQHA
jgi:type IV/VI secretion system ImpK/VasF family protein